MEQGLVDVLLPVFNGAATITEAIESIRRQSITELRIIIIDDGSTDDTPEILSAFARRDRRIKVLSTPNGGIVGALNTGLVQCEAEFVARQDADDISDPSRLMWQLEYLRSHATCVAVSGAARHIDEHGRFLGNIQYFPPPDHADPCWTPSREPSLLHPFLMARRAGLLAIGGYRYVPHSEDTDLYWRLLERGTLHNLSVPIGDYRMHAGSISGESIVGGRIIALGSQLAGLSALRRRTGRTDICFPRDAPRRYREAQTMSRIFELGRRQLNKDEAGYLRIAMAAKLLELTAYRPYELKIDDCRFIVSAFRNLAGITADNRRELRRLHAAAAARLFRKGLFHEAAALTPAFLYPSAAMRLGSMMLPRYAREFISSVRRPRSRRR